MSVEFFLTYDFTTIFLQELEFSFWQMAMKIPRVLFGHYDLNESSFVDIKPLLDINTKVDV